MNCPRCQEKIKYGIAGLMLHFCPVKHITRNHDGDTLLIYRNGTRKIVKPSGTVQAENKQQKAPGGDPAWLAMERQRETFDFFAAVIFGLDITRLGSVYLDDATRAAWEAWREAEENETMPALGPERETLKELSRLSIENLWLKQTTHND